MEFRNLGDRRWQASGTEEELELFKTFILDSLGKTRIESYLEPVPNSMNTYSLIVQTETTRKAEIDATRIQHEPLSVYDN
jgi:hypothetical protein